MLGSISTGTSIRIFVVGLHGVLINYHGVFIVMGYFLKIL